MTPSERTAKWRLDFPEKAKATRKRNYYANHEREKMARRNSGFKRLYGITVAERDEMIAKQSNRCAACRKPFVRTPHIDHCHNTKIVRGILCSGCNQALGNVGESILTLRALIRYLEKHNVA